MATIMITSLLLSRKIKLKFILASNLKKAVDLKVSSRMRTETS